METQGFRYGTKYQAGMMGCLEVRKIKCRGQFFRIANHEENSDISRGICRHHS